MLTRPSIDDAVDKVLEEADDFETELRSIEMQQSPQHTLSEIFTHLHEGEYTFQRNNSDLRKAKPDFSIPMLRLYAIEIEDQCFIVAGGAIKLTKKMDRPHLQAEIRKLKQVQDYLREEGIFSKDGLC